MKEDCLQDLTLILAFHPSGDQSILNLGRSLFCLLRRSIDERQRVLCLHNVSGERCEISIDLSELYMDPDEPLVDLVDGQWHRSETKGKLEIVVPPYAILWLGQTVT